MQTGFDVTAAVPKRLRAAEDAPASETMRGDRRITQAPSTDQKKVRRQMSRKTAVTYSAGECRMCEGDLIPMGRVGQTMKAQCADCGTKHELQGASVSQKTAAERFVVFSNLSDIEQQRLHLIAHSETALSDPCPACQDATWGTRDITGHADGSGKGFRSLMHCRMCDHRYEYARDRADQHGRTASSNVVTLLSLVGSTWEPLTDVSPYLGHTGMSAIARRAQSVLDTEEIL